MVEDEVDKSDCKLPANISIRSTPRCLEFSGSSRSFGRITLETLFTGLKVT